MKQKIYFEIKEGLAKDTSESLWAEQVSTDEYKLLNIPIFSYGVSFGDTVKTIRNEKDELLFSSISKLSGNSTYRLIVKGHWSDSHREKNLKPFTDLGCLLESAKFEDFEIYAINVAPNIDVHNFYQLLERGESLGVWSFEEANFEHETK